jgi:hypothetical protein
VCRAAIAKFADGQAIDLLALSVVVENAAGDQEVNAKIGFAYRWWVKEQSNRAKFWQPRNGGADRTVKATFVVRQGENSLSFYSARGGKSNPRFKVKSFCRENVRVYSKQADSEANAVVQASERCCLPHYLMRLGAFCFGRHK